MSRSLENSNASDSAVRNVLVVQNEATLRMGFAYALSNPTTMVETAASGGEALLMMEVNDYDIMILELMMPGMDGINVIETLRTMGNRIPVILYTASQHPNASLRAISLGVVDFLTNPTSPADVRRVVDYVIYPPPSPLSQALHAVRTGNMELAIKILANHPSPELKDRVWLRTLKLIPGAGFKGDTGWLEEVVSSDFPSLAFNALPIP